MSLTAQIAKHFREVHFGGNWTAVDLKNTLADITWQRATEKVQSYNTIAALVFHIHYYVGVALKVLQGAPLEGHDGYSFDVPNIESAQQWQELVDKTWADAESFADLVAQLPDSRLQEKFYDGKYGNYYRNLTGVIEHTHYHLGQIVLLKKMILPGGEK